MTSLRNIHFPQCACGGLSVAFTGNSSLSFFRLILIRTGNCFFVKSVSKKVVNALVSANQSGSRFVYSLHLICAWHSPGHPATPGMNSTSSTCSTTQSWRACPSLAAAICGASFLSCSCGATFPCSSNMWRLFFYCSRGASFLACSCT